MMDKKVEDSDSLDKKGVPMAPITEVFDNFNLDQHEDDLKLNKLLKNANKNAMHEASLPPMLLM